MPTLLAAEKHQCKWKYFSCNWRQ